MGLEQIADTTVQSVPSKAIRSYRTEIHNQKKYRFVSQEFYFEPTVLRQEQLYLIQKAYQRMLWETYSSRIMRSYGKSHYFPGTYLDLSV